MILKQESSDLRLQTCHDDSLRFVVERYLKMLQWQLLPQCNFFVFKKIHQPGKSGTAHLKQCELSKRVAETEYKSMEKSNEPASTVSNSLFRSQRMQADEVSNF